jgi:hypothetical protein
VNTGGGGGGGSLTSTGGAGGSGIVILAYPAIYKNITTIGAGLTYSLDTSSRPGWKVYSFTAGTDSITI